MARKAKHIGASQGGPAKTPVEEGLSAADARQWERVARGITPLPGSGLKPPAPPAPPAPEAAEPTPPTTRAAPPSRRPAPELPELRPGVGAGVDKRTMARLVRGQLAIDGRLDLHGMTQDEAHRALIGFVTASREREKRAVLIITGKGTRPEGGVGVLRAALPRWLNQAPLRGQVVAVAQAQPRHGGAGALYVLLKRVR